MALNQGKIREIARCSGRRDCRNVIFMPAAAQKSTLLFVVLCSNKEQQKTLHRERVEPK